MGWGQIINWNYNNAARATGSGCQSEGFYADTFFVSAGPEISVIFSQLGVNLIGPADPRNALNDCQVVIPLRVERGNFVASLEQTFLYGITKSADSHGILWASARFLTLPAARFRLQYKKGEAVLDPLLDSTVSNVYRQQARSWCRGNRPLEGTFEMTVRVNGHRAGANEIFILQMDGADIRFEALADIERCP